jgi:Gpi18-like mannosyltransferase
VRSEAKHWTAAAVAVLGSAVAIALLVGHVLRDSPGYAVRNPDGSFSGDITHYVYWTRLVTLGGIQSAYHGTWPETYAVYPPIALYPYQAIGTTYRWFVDPSFDPEAAQRSLWLHEAIKFVALTWHLLTAAAIVVVVRQFASPMLAALAGALYVANPAALYDVAHWGQPDGAHSLFSVLAVGALGVGWIIAAWLAIAMAALAKPQAWSLVPLLGIATLRDYPIPRLVRGVAAGGALALVVVAPFLLTGHAAVLLSLPGAISSVMPVVSADAHNLWWLVVEPRGDNPLLVQDSARFIGPLSFRAVAACLVLATFAFTYWLYLTRRASLAEAAALGVLGWFVFTTQAHENHLFFALPLLSLAWPERRSLLVPFGVISLTLLLNMVLHDQLVLESLGSGLDDPRLQSLRLYNAALNVACCLGWCLAAALRAPQPRSDRVRCWPPHSPTPAKAPT